MGNALNQYAKLHFFFGLTKKNYSRRTTELIVEQISLSDNLELGKP